MNIETLPLTYEIDPAVDEALTQWEQSNKRLEEEAGELSANQELPDWWYEGQISQSALVDYMKSIGQAGRYVGVFHELSAKETQLKNRITGRNSMHDSHPIKSTIYMFGPDIVAEGMKYEEKDGLLHTELLESMRTANENRGIITKQLETLKNYYGLDTMTDLLSVEGDSFSDEVRTCMKRENSLRWINYEENKYDSDKTYEENKRRDREWMAKAVAAAGHITQEDAEPYVFSGVNRNDDNKNLTKIIEAFDHFGADRLKHISKVTGIYGLEAYSITQLERMERFVQEPDKLAEELAEHDVIVVLNNRVGDHNGVLSNSSDLFEDQNDNTLFFEINSMGDIYRRMSLVHKAGIKPSSLVLAAHSNKGQFMVSDDRDPSMRKRDIATIAGKKLVEFAISNRELLPGDKAYAMEGMKGLTRMIDDYMQPSRGIDDDESNIGRKKIIFQACNMGTETERRDLDTSREKITIGFESVISRLADDVLTNDIASNVDIYGAPVSLQMHKTDNGVRFSGQPADGSLERTPVNSVRIRVADGKSQKQEVDEILMRKLKA